MTTIRIDKFISERTQYTRSQIKNLVSKGQIKVGESPVKRADVKINPEKDVVNVCGNVISANRYRYILLNKPEGFVCSTDERDGKPVMELIPEEMRTKNMFPVGRLDKDSFGALLITNDGELAHRILSPSSHIPKIYIVKLDRPFEIKYIDEFKNGIHLSNGEICKPAKVKSLENSDKLAFVELYEGKYHQVKRMFAAVGNHVQKLMRISVGGLVLPKELGFGHHMELLHKDVENLFEAVDFDTFCSDFSMHFSAILINK